LGRIRLRENIQMSWNSLPSELRVQILIDRNTIRDEMCSIIQQKWKRFYSPKNVAFELISKQIRLDYNDDFALDTLCPKTSSIMTYCVKVLSGKEKPHFWCMIIDLIFDNLYLNEYNGGHGAKYYNNNEYCSNILYCRFKSYF